MLFLKSMVQKIQYIIDIENDFPLEKYGTYGVHVDSDIPFAGDKYSIYMFRNDYAPFKYAFQYDCLTHLVKSELGKELLENGAKKIY